MPRAQLPNRRHAVTEAAVWAPPNGGEHCYTISVGFDPAGRISEVFIAGAKHGSAVAAMLHDAAVIISIALQSGATASELRRSTGRLGRDDAPACPIGEVLDRLAAMELELSP